MVQIFQLGWDKGNNHHSLRITNMTTIATITDTNHTFNVFPHVTRRDEPRVCIEFQSKPCDTLRELLREHGSHRPIGDGRRAWQFASASWDPLYLSLSMEGYNGLARSVRRIAELWRISRVAEGDAAHENPTGISRVIAVTSAITVGSDM